MNTITLFPYNTRPAQTTDWDILQPLWEISQDLDDPAFRPRTGWWRLGDWAKTGLVLSIEGISVGLAALNFTEKGSTGEVRLALLPEHRTSQAVRLLVQSVFDLAHKAGFGTLRFYLPGRAEWATQAVSGYGFAPSRAFHSMLLPENTEVTPVTLPEGVRIRSLTDGEDEEVLAALNRAWASTLDFHPILKEALQADLAGQREGFLVAESLKNESSRIIGTVHAMFDPTHKNYNGNSFSWISNLTNDPDWRGQGLGRALLAAGIQNLRERGGRSVGLGVDGGNPVPLRLYRKVGFETISRLEIWEGKVPNL